MIGLYVFLFIFLYVFIFFKLAKWMLAKVNGLFKKTLVAFCVAIAAFFILLGDHYFGMYKFHHICEKESGLKVFEKKYKPGGVLFETGVDENEVFNAINKYGLKLVERRVDRKNIFADGQYNRRDDVARYTVDEYGKIEKSIHHDYLSEYMLSFGNTPIGVDVQRRETVLSEVRSKKVVMAYYRYLYLGGWYVNHMLPRYGAMECPNEPKDAYIEELIIKSVFGK